MDPLTVRAAEQQMRRPAPTHDAKRQKVAANDGLDCERVARFNYASPQALAEGISGFLVTCSFRREKSATKEATGLLLRYLGQTTPALATATATSADSPHTISSNADSTPTAPAVAALPQYTFLLTKLACNGVIMLQHAIKKAPSQEAVTGTEQPQCGLDAPGSEMLTAAADQQDQHAQLVQVVKQIQHDIAAGTLKAPQFCERVIPVQITCSFSRDALQAATCKLAAQYARDAVVAADRNCLKFAVSYKSRGKTTNVKERTPVSPAVASFQAHDQEAGLQKQAQAVVQQPAGKSALCSQAPFPQQSQPQGPSQQPQSQELQQQVEKEPDAGLQTQALDRGQAIAVVATAVEQAGIAAGRAVQVDLQRPDVVIMLELLPVSTGVYCALAWLPASMTSHTPRLAVKPLAPTGSAAAAQPSAR